ncbi:Nn.00g083340.m01.CDS01 [Neocucurbitaria sp. VM-36]
MTDVSQHKPKLVIPEKVALVTAGSAGLGAQIARALAPDFRVCINYCHNAARADALIEELNSKFGFAGALREPLNSTRFVALQADVSDRPSILGLVRDVIALFGRLDVVASNAGWTRVTDFNDIDDNMDDDLWDRTYQCNVKAHFWLMQAAKPHLEASLGAFVTTASLAGVNPGGSSVPYAISKAAQIHLVKTLSLICAPKIRVNSVSPALMLTDWGLQFPEEQQLATREATRLKRLVTVEDVADVVRMLLLNLSITGQNIIVDSKSLPRFSKSEIA